MRQNNQMNGAIPTNNVAHVPQLNAVTITRRETITTACMLMSFVLGIVFIQYAAKSSYNAFQYLIPLIISMTSFVIEFIKRKKSIRFLETTTIGQGILMGLTDYFIITGSLRVLRDNSIFVTFTFVSILCFIGNILYHQRNFSPHTFMLLILSLISLTIVFEIEMFEIRSVYVSMKTDIEHMMIPEKSSETIIVFGMLLLRILAFKALSSTSFFNDSKLTGAAFLLIISLAAIIKFNEKFVVEINTIREYPFQFLIGLVLIGLLYIYIISYTDSVDFKSIPVQSSLIFLASSLIWFVPVFDFIFVKTLTEKYLTRVYLILMHILLLPLFLPIYNFISQRFLRRRNNNNGTNQDLISRFLNSVENLFQPRTPNNASFIMVNRTDLNSQIGNENEP